jgi:hypothetical protein
LKTEVVKPRFLRESRFSNLREEINDEKSLQGREANESPRGDVLRFDPAPAIRYPLS